LCVYKAKSDPNWILPTTISDQVIEKAEQGNPYAQNELGLRYKNGVCLEKKYEKSIDYLNRAAEQGSAEAQFNLATLLSEGVHKDEAQALEWATLSAKQNYAKSQWLLASMLLTRNAEEEDAKLWAMQAATNGLTQAQVALGLSHENGVMFEKNHKQALYWYELAARQDEPSAQFLLAYLLTTSNEIEKDKVQASKWMLRAGQQGYSKAYHVLGGIYQDGIGVEKDADLSFYWHHLAAQQGDIRSYEPLITFYLGGLGVETNFDKAMKWAIKSAKTGSVATHNMLKSLIVKTLKPLQENQAYKEDLRCFEKNLKMLYAHHLLKATADNLLDNSSSFSEEKSSEALTFYIYYKHITDFEKKVIDLIKAFAHPGFLVDKWELSIKEFLTSYRGKTHYFEEYTVDAHTYLSFGKQSVEKTKILIGILKGEDEELKAALNSLNILREPLRKSYKKLLSKAYVLQSKAREECPINLQGFQKLNALVTIKEKKLQELEEVANISKILGRLIHQGASHRNQVFEEEYPYLK
jgi:TPR repeat protein